MASMALVEYGCNSYSAADPVQFFCFWSGQWRLWH